MRIFTSAVVAASLLGTSAIAQAPEHETIEVMVLGTYHFDNPGLDIVDVAADDVMTRQRQEDLQALSDALAEWAPTRILVEAQPDTSDLHMESYRTEAAERVAVNRNEHYQIGYRLALQLGHDDVYGFDERGGDGEPDYFPFGTVQEWAAANGRTEELGALIAQIQAEVEQLSADAEQCSIAANLIHHNDPGLADEAHSLFYYGLMQFGDAENQPGAETNAYWYMRNAKMFAKVGLVTEPGDRVLIIVGSGHRYWLDHFASVTPGYTSVDPRPWLEMADDGRCDRTP